MHNPPDIIAQLMAERAKTAKLEDLLSRIHRALVQDPKTRVHTISDYDAALLRLDGFLRNADFYSRL